MPSDIEERPLNLSITILKSMTLCLQSQLAKMKGASTNKADLPGYEAYNIRG